MSDFACPDVRLHHVHAAGMRGAFFAGGGCATRSGMAMVPGKNPIKMIISIKPVESKQINVIQAYGIQRLVQKSLEFHRVCTCWNFGLYNNFLSLHFTCVWVVYKLS
jgi:hypothetical protein